MSRSRYGVVAWTAAQYIGQNPQASKREVKRHLDRTLGYNVNVGMLFAPSDPHKRRTEMRSSTMNILWVREEGRCRISGRRVWVHTLTERGREIAAEPPPPTPNELFERRMLRKRRSLHPADWAWMVDLGELVTARMKTSGSGLWCYGFLSLSQEGYGERTVTIERDEILVLIERSKFMRSQYNPEWGRTTLSGYVQVLNSRGVAMFVNAERLKPIKPVRRSTSSINK
jgi:hypothetical protein